MRIKNFTVLLFAFFSITAFAQVPKENVVIEKFTGIYCGACPSAVHNIHDLIENENADVTVISYHSAGPYSDPLFENADSDGRNTYYSSMIVGFPTTIFDGIEVPEFANGYEDFVDTYNQRKDSLSPVSIDLGFSWNGGDSYTANVTVIKESGITATDLRLQITLIETNIYFDWMGEEKLYDVSRKMLPDFNGSPLDFTVQNEITFNFDFTVDGDWNPDYCNLVAFVQDHDTKEIFQGAKVSIANVTETNDATPFMILGVDENFCGSTLTPQVGIRNSSGSNLSSLDINYSINGGTIQTYNWTGDLAPFDEGFVDLPAITFNAQSLDNQLLITTSNPNNSSDEDPSNNEISHSFDATPVFGLTPSIEFRTDEWPSLNNWELLDSEGTIIEQSGTLSSYTVYNESFDLAEGCYAFTIYDQTGNGFSNWAGENGYFIFYNAQGIEIVNIVDFGYELTILFETSATVDVAERILKDEFKTYPNPAKSKITIRNNLIISEYQIINSQGQSVIHQNNMNVSNLTVDVSSFEAGLYIVKIKDKSGIKTKKIQILN